MPTQTTQRLFFALWPDDAVRNSIASFAKQAAEHHQGKRVRTDNLHLTLAFLGNVDDIQRDCVEAMASSLTMTSFSLCLEHTGIFPRPKVLWLGVKENPDALMQLAASLRQGAQDCGVQLNDKGFNPHVTLMRKVTQLHDVELEPIHWKVNNFCLVQSISQPEGVEYRVVKSWQ